MITYRTQYSLDTQVSALVLAGHARGCCRDGHPVRLPRCVPKRRRARHHDRRVWRARRARRRPNGHLDGRETSSVCRAAPPPPDTERQMAVPSPGQSTSGRFQQRSMTTVRPEARSRYLRVFHELVSEHPLRQQLTPLGLRELKKDAAVDEMGAKAGPCSRVQCGPAAWRGSPAAATSCARRLSVRKYPEATPARRCTKRDGDHRMRCESVALVDLAQANTLARTQLFGSRPKVSWRTLSIIWYSRQSLGIRAVRC